MNELTSEQVLLFRKIANLNSMIKTRMIDIQKLEDERDTLFSKQIALENQCKELIKELTEAVHQII